MIRYATLAILITLGAKSFADEPVDYNMHVAPILRKYCSACHNADDPEGKLVLDTHASLLKGGEHGAAITPGRAETSRLIRLVTRAAKPYMPPDDSEPPKPEEIAILKRWIDEGARGPTGDSPDAMQLITPKIKVTAKAKRSINQIAASPRGDVFAIARFGEVEIVQVTDGTIVQRLGEIIGNVQSVSFSRDGAFVVSASGEPGLFGEAKLWNTRDWSLVKTFRGHKDALLCAQVSPDGKVLATSSYDQTIVLWDIESGKKLRALEGHNGAVFEVAFHPSGTMLASASGDRTVKLWRVADGTRLDTLKESTKELYTLAFTPEGDRLAAAGVDNRIRVWKIDGEGREGANPLVASQFAHEQAVLRMVFSPKGDILATSGEDSLVKIWNASDLSNRDVLEKQPDWSTALTISADGGSVVAGRLDGTWKPYAVRPNDDSSNHIPPALADVNAETDYGEQPSVDKLPRCDEVEPNNQFSAATTMSAPGVAVGRIFAQQEGKAGDEDWFRFAAIKGDQWILETNASRTGSPLDSKIEVFDIGGKPVPRLLLRAIRNTTIEFRGASSDQRGFRLENWEEMLLNDYVYLNGEVIKLFQQRRGPDADGSFFPENGNRMGFFDTTPIAHALGEPGYMVVPYPVGTKLPDNGLPVITLNFENDDDSSRRLGKDSRLSFVAPETGDYLVRVRDVRGFAGENYKYELIVRRPVPGFKVTLNGANPTINLGSGKSFSVKAERNDNYMGPIRVEIGNLPPGFRVTSPIEIPAGLYEAQGVINASADAPQPTPENMAATTIAASGKFAQRDLIGEINPLGTIKLADKAKVHVHLERIDAVANAVTTVDAPEVEIAAGGLAKCRLRVERDGFNDRIAFDVENLPHGVIVDDIGLSGVLIPEGETERMIVLRAESWVGEQSRLFHATAKVEGNQSSLPMRLVVKRQK